MRKMPTTIRKKSLYYSLQENRTKIQQTTKRLILFTILISLILIMIAFKSVNNIYFYVLLTIPVYAFYLCVTIYNLWNTRKKIKQKLKFYK